MSKTCSFCETEGHTVRSCLYKKSLPPIHTLMGDSTLCGIPRNMMPVIPSKVVHMQDRPMCPACTYKTKEIRKQGGMKK